MQSKEWAEELQRELDRENYPQWPNETMLKVLFGSYLKKKFTLPKNANVLDVGCFFGNNLFPFAAKGANCFGVDIHENIAKKAEIIFKKNGYDGKFTKGDYLLFYAKGPHVKKHQDNTIIHETHIYSDSSFYFLNVNASESPKRIDNQVQSTESP